MVFNWNDKSSEQFLNLYKHNECLWNTKHELYGNKCARENAYEKICRKMNLPGHDTFHVRNKINTMRTTYKALLNKIIKSEKSGGSYVPRLAWFKKADDFLRGTVMRNMDATNLKDQEESYVKMKETVIKQSKRKFMLVKTDRLQVKGSNLRKSTNSLRIDKFTKLSINKQSASRIADRRHISQLIAIKMRLNKIQETLDQHKEVNYDEFDLFGKSIALQLRKMPLERALTCQVNLQKVMNQERLDQFINDPTCIYK